MHDSIRLYASSAHLYQLKIGIAECFHFFCTQQLQIEHDGCTSRLANAREIQLEKYDKKYRFKVCFWHDLALK